MGLSKIEGDDNARVGESQEKLPSPVRKINKESTQGKEAENFGLTLSIPKVRTSQRPRASTAESGATSPRNSGVELTRKSSAGSQREVELTRKSSAGSQREFGHKSSLGPPVVKKKKRSTARGLEVSVEEEADNLGNISPASSACPSPRASQGAGFFLGPATP